MRTVKTVFSQGLKPKNGLKPCFWNCVQIIKRFYEIQKCSHLTGSGSRKQTCDQISDNSDWSEGHVFSSGSACLSAGVYSWSTYTQAGQKSYPQSNVLHYKIKLCR